VRRKAAVQRRLPAALLYDARMQHVGGADELCQARDERDTFTEQRVLEGRLGAADAD
jgi:hypothetical protein